MDRQVAQHIVEALPDQEDILRVWRADRCVRGSSAGVYLQWIRRFRAYCARQGLDERGELTLSGARRFIKHYAQLRRLNPRRQGGARTALYALSRVYQVMGLNPPPWQPPAPAPPPRTKLLREYADHLHRRRGKARPHDQAVVRAHSRSQGRDGRQRVRRRAPALPLSPSP